MGRFCNNNALPSFENRCCVVLRLEDCLLSEQPGVLKEFFGNRTGYLPEGSVLLFGSLSHLSLRGLETYAEEVVKSFKIFTSMLAGGCTVAHTVHFPLGGIESDGVVRDLYDLDAWLRSGVVGAMLSLPITRERFWRVVRSESVLLANQCTSERVLFLPENISNSHKIRTIAGSVDSELPEKIKPLSVKAEEQIVETLMIEIGEKFAIPVDQSPNLDRCSGDTVFCKVNSNGSRVFAIGCLAYHKVGGLFGRIRNKRG